MQDSKLFKHQLAQFGRSLSLFLNRASMYEADHPYFKDSLDSFFSVAYELTQYLSPYVFILSQDRFFIDEEPLDPRINVARLLQHFKKGGIKSISFYKGLRKTELRLFMEIFTAIHNFPDVNSMIKAMERKGIRNVKLNHVYYQKVTSEDEVVSRDALKKMTPEVSLEAERKSKKLFLDALIENVLTEEFEKTLSVRSLISDPARISKSMIENDLAAVGAVVPPTSRVPGNGMPEDPAQANGGKASVATAVVADQQKGHDQAVSGAPGHGVRSSSRDASGLDVSAGSASSGVPGTAPEGGSAGHTVFHAGHTGLTGKREREQSDGQAAADIPGVPDQGSRVRHGTVLAHQLELISEEIENSLLGEGEVDLQNLAMAVFQMKTELIQGIESQKALGIAYENEQSILDKANELTDRVFLRIIKDEYTQGNIATKRMAQILRRLIPDPDELKRLLPKIKTVLLEAGMPLADYLQLIKDLGRELQEEGIARLLQESAEQVGVDGDDLIEEIKKDPKQAAELMALAAEIRKGTQDEQTLTEVLVEYMERMGANMGRDFVHKEGLQSDDHLRNVITGVESKLVRHLREMDLGNDVLARIENKINERLDSIVESIKLDYIHSSDLGNKAGEAERLSLLQTIERSVSESDELAEILKHVRRSADTGRIDADDFVQIYAEIERIKQALHEKEVNRELPRGVINQTNLRVFVEKEISKAHRYEIPFCALAFTIVKARFKESRPERKIPSQQLLDRLMHRLSTILRDTDLVGTFRKNQAVALLPLTPLTDAKLALKRTMNLLHSNPFTIDDIPLDVTFAGTALAFNKGRTPDANTFLETLSSDLAQMAARVRNIHALM